MTCLTANLPFMNTAAHSHVAAVAIISTSRTHGFPLPPVVLMIITNRTHGHPLPLVWLVIILSRTHGYPLPLVVLNLLVIIMKRACGAPLIPPMSNQCNL